MEKLCDLHTHSIFSDGTFSPSQLIDEDIAAVMALVEQNIIFPG